jgi:predicted RNA-binding protein associated with RNAse of E/G family
VTLPLVRIHYLRPPDREEILRQQLVHDDGSVKVTYAERIVRRAAIHIDGARVLERGSDIVWFTFPGAWHDIGRFHLADGSFTGVYANVLTPALFESENVWRTTDLFLDIWLARGAAPRVLDREEFDEAVQAGWIDERTRQRALEEVDRILEAAAAGVWPPPVVAEWPLERARAAAAAALSTGREGALP